MMKKFCTLYCREMRLARKTNILSLIIMILFSVMIFYVTIELRGSPSEENLSILPNMPHISFLILPFMGGMNGISYDCFKKDISVKWLDFSYTLPISPAIRAAVLLAKKLTGLFCGLMIAVLTAPFLCHAAGQKFESRLFSAGLLVICLVLFFGMITDFFSLRSRTIADLEKNSIKMGVCLTVIAFLSSAILKKFLNFKGADYSFFKGEWLLWLIPLTAALAAADFFIIKMVLKSAYNSSDKTEKLRADSSENHSLIPEASLLSGFLYKEFTQSRKMLLILILLPFAGCLFPFAANITYSIRGSMTIGELFEESVSKPYILLTLTLGIVIASMIITGFFSGDDKKQWAYFVAASPKSIKNYMYSKYLLTFAAAGLYMVSYIISNELLATVYYFVTAKEMPPVSGLSPVIFYILLFMAMADIPLSVRFGVKKGSYIKTALILAFSILGTVIFCMLPYSVTKGFIEFLYKIYLNDTSTVFMLCLSAFCLVSLTGFYCSYKVSCRLFMKGAESNG